jgi:hypothetical protein
LPVQNFLLNLARIVVKFLQRYVKSHTVFYKSL